MSDVKWWSSPLSWLRWYVNDSDLIGDDEAIEMLMLLAKVNPGDIVRLWSDKMVETGYYASRVTDGPLTKEDGA